MNHGLTVDEGAKQRCMQTIKNDKEGLTRFYSF